MKCMGQELVGIISSTYIPQLSCVEYSSIHTRARKIHHSLLWWNVIFLMQPVSDEYCVRHGMKPVSLTPILLVMIIVNYSILVIMAVLTEIAWFWC